MSKLSQAKIIDLNREKFDAVYFLDGQRILTYGSINKMTALEEQMKFQKRHKSPITMILIPEGVKPVLEHSRDIDDYYKYLE